MALNLIGYAIQKRDGDPISHLLASTENLPLLAEEGNCALDCMDKLASALNALKWIQQQQPIIIPLSGVGYMDQITP